MESDIWKFAITAIGSGSLVATLLKVMGPMLKLNAAGNEASARAIGQWETLYSEQKTETAAAMKALDESREDAAKAEGRALRAERKVTALEAELKKARDRIQKLEGPSP